MKIRNLLLLAISIFLLNACQIGDTDDLEIIYQPTLIELVCQTPEISNFCDLMYRTTLIKSTRGNDYGQPIASWTIQFSGRSGVDAATGIPCASNVETVFAPSNEAFEDFFSTRFPRWVNITDTDTTLDFAAIDASIAADSSASDSITMIVLHHIYRDNGSERGAKLYVEIDMDTAICTEERIIRGNIDPYKMMDGNHFIFAENVSTGDVAALSLTTTIFSIVDAPDMATTDGAIYIIDKVLGPFFP